MFLCTLDHTDTANKYVHKDTAKRPKFNREIEPDILKILVLISLEVAQNSSHLFFLEKSGPDFSKKKIKWPSSGSFRHSF